ncbi:RmlC-like cupin [Eremomyces bilateralis CBS 781.70]|uniref:RmlC-like cupin n=1 Tax=Eremomyces bilateralis CBS 781.70 TaxID=1392243 RepID=A0A6G1FXB1_9PEZI|nr:RmlC-like cupin [Eremomyces bilateralis CBS 781.70]KAF1810535.1 RmlC-like cupin [Eremomyces bilateralis CBS 781.70]
MFSRRLLPTLFCIIAIAIYNPSITAPLTKKAAQLGINFLSAFRNLPKPNLIKIINPSTMTSKPTPSAPFVGFPVIPPNHTCTHTPRTLSRILPSRDQPEGAGARVRRTIGTPSLRNLTPFLMLDHFRISADAGFPDHPHRGQETITYLISGGVDHEDFAGNRGRLEPGDLQFMTAGRGIVHAEMPAKEENEGMQLWVDLPEELKGCEPRYRDLRAAEVPRVEADGGRVKVKVISGRSYGTESAKELAYTPVWFLDVEMQAGAKFEQEVPDGWTAFVYLMDGAAKFGADTEGREVKKFDIAVFKPEGDEILASTAEGETARFIVVAGMPLDQPIVQYGPFVVTSREEVYQAMEDYQSHANGFERAKNWGSEIGKRMEH